MAAWDNLNLQSKNEWKTEEIPGWGVGFVRIDKETNEREEIVDFPVTFTNGQGQSTVVHQLCYKSQTQGQGLMTVLTCMSQPRNEHHLVKITGTDTQAQKFFEWAIQDQAFITGNPKLLSALKDAAAGKKPLVLVQGDLAGIPTDLIKNPEEIAKEGLKAEGIPFGANVAAGRVNSIGIVPFERNGKVFAVTFEDYEYTINYFVSKGKTEKFAITDIIRMVLNRVSNLNSDGNYVVFTDTEAAEGRRLIIDIPAQLNQVGISVDMVLK